jgi:Fe-S oxidoreductase
MELSSRIHELIQNCENCGRCKRVCPFLDTYGTPAKIITGTPEKVFFCTNCKACDSVCKENLNPSDALFEIKTQLVRSGTYPTEVRNALHSANGYAMRGHKPPFVYYSSGDTVFWPGCDLAGMSPEMVKKTVRLLSKHLNKQVGLVLDCCFDPAYELGDIESVKEAAERIRERLEKNKITHVIVGCTNCRKALSLNLSEAKVEHIFEVLPEDFINPSLPHVNSPLTKGARLPSVGQRYRGVIGGEGGFYTHHPCPSFRFDAIRIHAKAMLQSTGNENSLPSCCGPHLLWKEKKSIQCESVITK